MGRCNQGQNLLHGFQCQNVQIWSNKYQILSNNCEHMIFNEQTSLRSYASHTRADKNQFKQYNLMTFNTLQLHSHTNHIQL